MKYWVKRQFNPTYELIEANHPNASWEEKVIIAINVCNAFVNVARQGVADVRVILKLENNRPLWDYKTREKALATDKENPLSGDTLNKKIIDEASDIKSLEDAMTLVKKFDDEGNDMLYELARDMDTDGANAYLRTVYEDIGCFPAGTRVMTDKGLVPIESIKVGDKVLSKPEDNTGEAEFKPVLKKFVHDNKELWTLTYVEIPSNMDRNKLTTDKLKRLSRKGKFITIEATPNHPFWVEGEGWTRLDHLQYGHIIQSKKDGMVCMVFNVSPMFQTNIDKIAVLYSIRNILDADKKGEDIDDVTYYDFAKYGDDGYVAEFLNDGHDSPSPLNVEGYPSVEVSTETYRTTVYNFEVADHHTYYVWDLWVHNKNCELVGFNEGTPLSDIVSNDRTVVKPGKAIIAINVRNAFVNAARQGIADVKVILKLENNRPLWDYKTRERALAEQGLSGKELNQKLHDEAFDIEHLKLETKHVACFVAGTLVHTKKGLVPIESIKVGDEVLSKDEYKGGVASYKKVVRTLSNSDKFPILALFYKDNYSKIEENYCESKLHHTLLTENHPIWINRVSEYNSDTNPDEILGWVQSKDLLGGYEVDLINTSIGGINGIYSVYETEFEDVVYTIDHDGLANYLFDLSNNKIKCYFIKHLFFNDFDFDSFNQYELLTFSNDISLGDKSIKLINEFYNFFINRLDDRISYRKVYNIEVEDFHTYFVGEQGLWVHNTNGCFSEDELLDNLNNESFMRSPEAKPFRGQSMPVTTKDEILESTKPVTKGKELYHSAYVSADAQKILNLNPSHYADLATDKENPLSGEALNKKIYNEAFDVEQLKLETKHNACFVAGTLVHTDKGLVPIEKLKVGDMVLSRHEDQPDGELAYKRVLSTFKSPEKEKIIYVDYLTERGSGYFFCTENHPFWIDTLIEHKILEDGKEVVIRDAIGWEQAIKLDGCSQHSLRTFDGKIAYVNTFEDDNKILGTLPRLPNYVLIFNTEEAIGVIDFGGDYPIVLDGEGTQLNSLTSISTSTLMETEKKRLIINSQDAEEYEKLIKAGISYEKIYEAYVYNIEVEDYHTYFVGDTGIWVRDKS